MQLTRYLLPALITMLSLSCKKDSEVTETPYLRKYWNETGSSNYEVPITKGTEIKAKMFLNLMTDDVFYYDILVDSTLQDVITGAALYYGTASGNGALLADMKPEINGRSIKGSVQLTAAQATDMMTKPMFLNVQSKLYPQGLVRLQLEKNIDWYADVALDGASVVPSVTTGASGKVVLRITTDKVLHYQVMVTGTDGGDVLQEAHVHTGAAGTTGAEQVKLITTAADYNKEKSAAGLTDAVLTLIKSSPCYIDVHSTAKPAGLLRGQLR
jgi:CHRD domain-containing protein